MPEGVRKQQIKQTKKHVNKVTQEREYKRKEYTRHAIWKGREQVQIEQEQREKIIDEFDEFDNPEKLDEYKRYTQTQERLRQNQIDESEVKKHQNYEVQVDFLSSEFTDFEEFIWNYLEDNGLMNEDVLDELYYKYPNEISKIYDDYYSYEYDTNIYGHTVKKKKKGVRNKDYVDTVNDTILFILDKLGISINEMLDEFLESEGINQEDNPSQYNQKKAKYLKNYNITGNPLFRR